MATYNTEKFYWLKLKRDFFKRHDITIIENMPNGKDYVLFYLKLLCESIDHTGELRFSDTIPYDEQMLASITATNIDIVRSAMKVFVSLKMVDILDDKTIYMRELNGMIGGQTIGAEHKQIQREKSLKYLPEKTGGGQGVDKCPLEIEIEKEKEIDIDINKKVNKKDELLAMLADTTFSEAIKKSLEDWLNYKKFKYEKKGFESLLTIVSKNIDIYGETAVCNLIPYCMSNLWKGIIWEKLEKNNYKKADNPKSSALDQMKRVCEKFDGEENGTV